MRKTLKDYEQIVGKDSIEGILKEAEPLKGKYITHVNSTYYGGGVAEILDSLVYLMNEVGINADWRLLKGSDEFFRTTKFFHNGCQGMKVKLTARIKNIFEQTNQRNARFMHLERSDAVVIHDPQALPLIDYYPKRQPWIWRCHVDLSKPDPVLWRYLKKFIDKYDRVVVSDKNFIKKELKPSQTVIMPSIDPTSEKNKKINKKTARSILRRLGIDSSRPIISQISRFDRWKDPLGVVEAFILAKKKYDCQLVLLGNYAADDPEGGQVFEEVRRKVKNVKDVIVLANMEDNDMVVNALQTISTVVIQKSTKEGFGLTVSEALWKGTPVIGGRAGGIPNQILEGENGFLVGTVTECAEKIVQILRDPDLGERMGKFGHCYVRDHFLITRHLLDYVVLLKSLMAGKPS